MIVIAASVAVGIYLCSRLNQRAVILSEYIRLLEEVSSGMQYISDDLAHLFKDNFAGFPFTEKEPFDRQFREMTLRFEDVLKQDDLRILDDLGRDLGVSDVDSQLKHIRLYITLLRERLDEARDAVDQKGKLYRILPLSIGVAAAVLLI